MICSEDGVLHSVAGLKGLFGGGIGKVDCILARVLVREPRSVVAHRLHHKDGGFVGDQIGRARNHMIHAERVLSLQPNLLRLRQIVRVHHYVPQP